MLEIYSFPRYRPRSSTPSDAFNVIRTYFSENACGARDVSAMLGVVCVKVKWVRRMVEAMKEQQSDFMARPPGHRQAT